MGVSGPPLRGPLRGTLLEFLYANPEHFHISRNGASDAAQRLASRSNAISAGRGAICTRPASATSATTKEHFNTATPRTWKGLRWNIQ